MRVTRSWETLSNASAMAEQVVTLVKYSKAMRYIHSGSGIESHLPSESLCLFLCGVPPLRISCYWYKAGQSAIERSAHMEAISHLRQGLALLQTLPETP